MCKPFVVELPNLTW